MSPAKKKMVICVNCGKKYSSDEDSCPHCSETGETKTDESSVLSAGAVPGAELDDIESKDIAKWLMGEKEDFGNVITPQNEEMQIKQTPTQDVDKGETQDSGYIEAWLKGKVDDISSWLSGETETQREPTSSISIPESQASEELREASAEFELIINEYKSGKLTAEDLAEKAIAILSGIDSLREENARLREELESVRKGSTAMAKYFKSAPGQEGVDGAEIAGKLAEEMANREQLEIQNLELKASLDALKEQIDKEISKMPADQKEIKKLQLEIAEKQKQVEQKLEFFKKKEKDLQAEETDSRVEMREKFASELQERITDFEKREETLRTESERLSLKNKELIVALKQKNEEIQLLSPKAGGQKVSDSLMTKLAEMQKTERELALRNEELIVLKDKLQAKDDEMKAMKEPMRYKEDELLRREEDMLHREKLMEEEIRRLERAKAELGSQDELDLKKRIEQLQQEVAAKEEEIKQREKFLSAKGEELKLREQSLIGQEIDKRAEERSLEFKIEKVKTGTSRLDDLLMGGLPFGTNVLVYGPPFLGKEVLASVFVAEGLTKGIPTIWVTTEKTPVEIREEMKFVLSGFEEYEKLGLVRFVDSYSRSMGDTSNDPNVVYVDTPTDFQAIQAGIEKVGKELLEKHKYYRFVFRSISTMIAYLDPATAFRFLNPIAGRRKRDRAVSMFMIEKGMHGEQEIQMVGSLMDGMIEFKVENLNTFLSVKGIGDVQSRAWIRYTSTKSAVNIGSFALDHIR